MSTSEVVDKVEREIEFWEDFDPDNPVYRVPGLRQDVDGQDGHIER